MVCTNNSGGTCLPLLAEDDVVHPRDDPAIMALDDDRGGVPVRPFSSFLLQYSPAHGTFRSSTCFVSGSLIDIAAATRRRQRKSYNSVRATLGGKNLPKHARFKVSFSDVVAPRVYGERSTG